MDILHTSERIKYRSLQTKKKLDRILDKVELDRSLRLKEKMKLLWADDSQSNEAPSEGLKQKVAQNRIR